MIKIDTIEDKNGFQLLCSVRGSGGVIAQELAAILDEMAKEHEDVVAAALEMYLDMRGFKVEE